MRQTGREKTLRVAGCAAPASAALGCYELEQRWPIYQPNLAVFALKWLQLLMCSTPYQTKTFPTQPWTAVCQRSIGAEQERSGERAVSAAHSLLQL